MRAWLVAIAGVVSVATGCQSNSGLGLIKRMRQQNGVAADSGVVLVKDATFTDGRQQRWYDAALPPGYRRLDIAPIDSSNGLLFRSDSIYEISRGAIANARPYVHALSLLSHDVYVAKPNKTGAKLVELGFDINVVHETTWQDRPTYVIGAKDGDRTTNQFWIDRERLYLVRLIEQRTGANDEPGKPPLVQEVWLEGYRQHGGRWIPTTLSYFHNGRQFLKEQVEVLHANFAMDPGDFSPSPWLRAHWLSGLD